MPDPGKFSCIYDMNVLFEQSDQRAASFLQQRIPMALQIGNAACVLGTVSDRDPFEEIYYIYNYHTYIFFGNLYIIAAFVETCFYRSTGIVAGMSCLLVVFCCY